jgi:hypothetical protein
MRRWSAQESILAVAFFGVCFHPGWNAEPHRLLRRRGAEGNDCIVIRGPLDSEQGGQREWQDTVRHI